MDWTPSGAASPSFAAVAGRPAARVDRVASSVTGRVLNFVTPVPLPELLCGLGADAEGPATGAPDVASMALLLPIVGFRSSQRVIDSAQAQRAGDMAFAHARYTDHAQLVELARLIDPRSRGLREDMMFSGAYSASAANHVYAPPEEVPQHFGMLAAALSAPPSGIAAYPFALVAGYYASALHPFVGGNGRWSRLVALQAATAAGRPADGLMAAAFMATLNATLAGTIWPRAVDAGLQEYVGLGLRFRSALQAECLEPQALQGISSLLAILGRYSPSRRELERCLVRTMASDAIDLADIKTRFALSAKRAAGLAEALQQAGPGIAPDLASLGYSSAAMKLAISARNRSMEAIQ